MKKEKDLTPDEMVANWEAAQASSASKAPSILINRIKTPDGTVLSSYHVHDYVTHTDKNGLEYMVDGGTDYLRRNVHESAPYEELSITTEATYKVIRENLSWGSYGKDGKSALAFFPLSRMADDHLEAILEANIGGDGIRHYMDKELKHRKAHNIHVAETV